MRNLKMFETFERARAYAYERARTGDTYQQAQMVLLDKRGNYTTLGVISRPGDVDRFRGIEWDAIDWTEAGEVDGRDVAILQAYVGRNKARGS